MIRGFLLFFAALVFAGAMGFALGVYVGPAIDPGQFRATVDGGVVAISKSAVSVLEKLEITPAKVPPATTPMEGEAAPSKEDGSDASIQPRSDAGSGQPQSDAGSGDLPANDATPPDRQVQDVAEPGGLVTELQSGHSTPAINAEETVGSISPAPPANRRSDKQARRPGNKPVAKLIPRPKPAHKPVARLRPKPMPVYTPVARLKPKPKPNLEPEPAPKPFEQPVSILPQSDGGDSWLPWLR
jgi:hypothetical protein